MGRGANARPDDVGGSGPTGYTGAMSEKKPGVTDKRERVSCLRCNRMFRSPDKRHIRLCPNCRDKKS